MMGVGVGDMWAAQYLCPWSFTKDTAGPGPHGAGERHVQYLEGFLGTVGGLGERNPFPCTVFMFLFRCVPSQALIYAITWGRG